MGNLPQICGEGKLKTRARKPKFPSPKPPLAGAGPTLFVCYAILVYAAHSASHEHQDQAWVGR